MLRYETHKDQIEKIFKLINTGKFYSLTFIKKGNGELRYLNGHRATYKKPDGSDGIVRNVGYDPKDHNLIRVWDRNALNPITGQKTGNYRAAALENIIYIKCGNDLFDFIEENQIEKRFPYIDINDIGRKMKIEGIVDNVVENFMNESEELLGLPELVEYLSRVHPNVHSEEMLGMLQQEYQQDGDEAVVNFFTGQTGIKLQILSKGKYAFKY